MKYPTCLQQPLRNVRPLMKRTSTYASALVSGHRNLHLVLHLQTVLGFHHPVKKCHHWMTRFWRVWVMQPTSLLLILRLASRRGTCMSRTAFTSLTTPVGGQSHSSRAKASVSIHAVDVLDGKLETYLQRMTHAHCIIHVVGFRSNPE